LIGIGGIGELTDALEFFMAGASAVQVGTANFNDPGTALRIIDDLSAYCNERNICPADLVGTVDMGQ
jgi:dihydroorotate dehydrogenase (NAD+) catalytic subunit